MLVTDGRRPDLASDVEGFGAGSGQFDSDITDGRYPRAAIGYDDTYVYAVVVDGRSDGDAGMSLTELADFMSERLGVTAALNLDGGGSATLAARDPEGAFHVINNPMDAHNVPDPRRQQGAVLGDRLHPAVAHPSSVGGQHRGRAVHQRPGGHDGDVVARRPGGAAAALHLQHGLRERVHPVQVALPEQAAVRVDRQLRRSATSCARAAARRRARARRAHISTALVKQS